MFYLFVCFGGGYKRIWLASDWGLSAFPPPQQNYCLQVQVCAKT